MCGIAGYIALSDRVVPDEEVLGRMLRRLEHRGPDSGGICIRDRLALGFRRLSIIDRTNSDQPIFNEDGSIVLACNGEIFNYRPLREELRRRGHQFRTNGDVEALIHLYEDRGDKMFDGLNGQFAAVIYDFRRRRLLLARDHFGICPLYYFESPDVLVFASEIKALLEHPLVPRELDPRGLDQLFTTPALTSPQTLFRGIRCLRHGSYLELKDGALSEHEYWDLSYPQVGEHGSVMSAEQYAGQLLDLLYRSVELRLQADVDVGVYLSGGLDSTIIASLMHRLCPAARRHSFSVSVPGNNAYCESRYQRIAATHCGTIHHDVSMDGRAIAARLQTAVRHSEAPLRETYNTASLALSERARQCEVPVVLCGEGADELFAGYDGYVTDHFRGKHVTSKANGCARECEDGWPGSDIVYHDSRTAREQTRSGLYSPELLELLRREGPPRSAINPDRLAGRHPIHQRSYLDFVIRLSGHLLADHGDRMAMANSVEARYPFLDIDLVNFVTQIPPELKFDGRTEKAILRSATAGLLPAPIAGRRKFPFSTPGSPELLRCEIEWIEELLSEDRIRRDGYFSPKAVSRLRRRYLSSDFELNVSMEEDWMLLVLTFGIWLDEFGISRHN
jgi:asparagine synthase (glutamine-hydrolysing)